MGKSLIHNNEVHLISQPDIHAAVRKMIEELGLAAGSMESFDIYKVVETYFTDLNKRHKINCLLNIEEDPAYYGEEEQIKETAEAQS